MSENTLKKHPAEMLHCAPAHKGSLSCLAASRAKSCQIDSTWHPSSRSSDCYRVRGEPNNAAGNQFHIRHLSITSSLEYFEEAWKLTAEMSAGVLHECK